MKEKSWVKKALLLGFTFFIAILLSRPIGVSTQYSVLSGIIHASVDSSVISENSERSTGYESRNAYYDRQDGKIAKDIKNPWNYAFIFVLAIPFGAYAAYSANDKKRVKMSDVAQKSSETKIGFFRQYLPSFCGGFILLYGARLADGCTSGHMMSGMMQGSVSGYLFAASVFAVAIPVAILIGKSRGKKE